MAAGIPGVGIGGLFYVLSAVGAPFCALYRARTQRDADGAPDRAPLWGQSLRLCMMAVGIIAAMWLTGVLVGNLMFAMSQRWGEAGAQPLGGLGGSIWKISALALSLGTLSLVLAVVQIARRIVGTGRARTRTA